MLSGSAFGDRMFGRQGRDLLRGREGNDCLWGGEGADVLDGDGGDDSLWGGDGRDRLFGGSGNDRLLGGAKGDELHGDTGNDQLFPGTGRDRVWGGPGNDTISARDGSRDVDRLRRGARPRDRGPARPSARLRAGVAALVARLRPSCGGSRAESPYATTDLRAAGAGARIVSAPQR